MAMDIRQHVEDRRRGLTPLQMDGLSNDVLAIHNYLRSWKAHELGLREASLIRASTAPASPRTKESCHAENPIREIVEAHLSADADCPQPSINESSKGSGHLWNAGGECKNRFR